jgi:hypothetical protein
MWRIGLAALMAVATAVGAGAQVPGIPASCRGQMISDIEIRTHSPFEGKGNPWWQAPIRWASALSTTTEPSVIRRYLILQPGMPCDERRRAESERLLRVQPFIARSSIRAFDDGRGGVRLVVETTDEVTTVIGAGASGPRLTGLRLGDRSVAGSGTSVVAEWRDGELRDTYGLQVVDYQFLGRRYILDVAAAQRDLDRHDWHVDLGHRFLTDEQRIAWRATAAESRELFGFLRGPDLEPAMLGMDRTFIDIGGVIRIGVPGRLSLFGVSISRETDGIRLPTVQDSTVDYAALRAPFVERSNARLNALWAVRNITYRRVERFDALTATQDVARGFQFGTLFGRSLGVIGTSDDDILVAADLYAGLGGGSSFVRINARGEGRQNYDRNRWDGILGSGRLTAYQRLGESNTATASLDWSGGWRQRIPFQLSLGDRRGGVRGYRRSRDAGGRRAVARLEDRFYLGDWRGQADIGVALFADAGRLWAGDVPYGVDTRIRASFGVGVLAAVPAGSKRNWRLDFIFPLRPGGGGRFDVRLTTQVPTRIEWREPGDLTRSRERSVPSSMF